MIQEKTREDVRDDKKGKGEKHRENKTRLQHTRENMSQSPVQNNKERDKVLKTGFIT